MSDLERVDGWHEYVELARRLDAVRAEETARTAGMRAGVAEMSGHVDDLEARLRGQGQMLARLASALHLRPPKLLPVVPEGPVEPATALAQVAADIDQGDVESKRAERRGGSAGLLPALKPGPRAVVVYVVAALLVLIAQLPIIRGKVPYYGISVIVIIPAIGFGLAVLLLRLGGRVRLHERAPEIPVRLGFALCFAIGPVVQLIGVLRSAR